MIILHFSLFWIILILVRECFQLDKIIIIIIIICLFVFFLSCCSHEGASGWDNTHSWVPHFPWPISYAEYVILVFFAKRDGACLGQWFPVKNNIKKTIMLSLQQFIQKHPLLCLYFSVGCSFAAQDLLLTGISNFSVLDVRHYFHSNVVTAFNVALLFPHVSIQGELQVQPLWGGTLEINDKPYKVSGEWVQLMKSRKK